MAFDQCLEFLSPAWLTKIVTARLWSDTASDYSPNYMTEITGAIVDFVDVSKRVIIFMYGDVVSGKAESALRGEGRGYGDLRWKGI
jgi:hypothetical protein